MAAKWSFFRRNQRTKQQALVKKPDSANQPLSQGYSTWEQLSGYFDGDGAIGIRIGAFTIQILAMWNDTDPEQIQDVARFLIREGIMPGGPYVRRGRGRRVDSSSLVVAE